MFIKPKKKYLRKILPVGCILAVIVSWCSVAYSIPDEIRIMKGKEVVFDGNLPLQAEIVEEDIGVLNVNNKAVSENIHFNLAKPFTVKSEKEGTAKLEVSVMGILPVKTVEAKVIPNMQVVAGGIAVGVSMDTRGIMVLGTGYVNGIGNKVYEPAKGILQSGDMILQAGGKSLKNKEDLMKAVEENGEKSMDFLVDRNGVQQKVEITPVFSQEDNSCKIGIWVRDSTQGIGTITYFNTDTNNFGALGHGVYDVDTQELMQIKNGQITQSSIIDVKKGEKGEPGALTGNVGRDLVLGSISINTEVGIYGKVEKGKESYFTGQKLPIALQQDIHEGKATILSNIEGEEVKEYEIEIESVNRYSKNESKGMVIKIVDKELLSKTGGIVQGMSGSPILQEGKIVGAVTHVFVNEPTKGYGIFIENMLKQESAI
ncbi:SpoIVB peptidase [Clostridium sp. MD294]|uniref:SpoIVB peptidase n=1 Tax=Clostridium sp. MD294 TaxID=97138 RepID=UPI0002CC944A|nr:SpoIVB peptidase [Clostridium sp. MD294]NDO46800.1 SpoIVB peptidase [Clostridium sp. MD294]USF28758.1 SpoIVB peptidase [Clostridium sp. MD294]